MSRMRRYVGMIALMIGALGVAAAHAAGLTDPYEIMANHYQALGGLEKLKAQKTTHVEGALELVGTGLAGTFLQWTESPIRQRQDVDLKVIKSVSGDNGEFAWTVDQNGKLLIRKDEETIKDRQVQSLLAQYAHMDRASEVFTLTYDDIDTASGRNCYAVRVSNTINTDVTTHYYDTASFLELKQWAKTPEGETRTWYSDYRPVDGVPFAFTQETIELPSGMKQVITFSTVEFNVPVDAALFEPPGEDVEDFHFTNGKSAESVAFRFIENHIYLPVKVGGNVRLWVLDTGAEMSVIDERFARELGLAIEGNIKGQGAGNQVDVSFTTLPELSVPGLTIDPQTAAVIDLQSLFNRWLGMEVVGILGYDFLSRVVTRVDYANERLSFHHPDSFEYHGDGVVLNAPVSQNKIMDLPVLVDGRHGGVWSLDLGAGGMSYHYQYAEANGLLDSPGADALAHGAGGSFPTRRTLSNTMELAGFTVKNVEITVPREKGAGSFGHTDKTGNIGNTLLRNFNLVIDYKRGQVIVEKGDNFGKDFPRDNSGLQLAHVGQDSLQVIHVAPGSPAAEAGFRVDDYLVSVNGLKIEYLGGIIAVNKMLREKPGTKYTIEVRRGGELNKLTMTLRDLFASGRG
ncbi:MAG: aspartyl protease family protein [Candidatus Zixiibacteriota bacterium]